MISWFLNPLRQILAVLQLAQPNWDPDDDWDDFCCNPEDPHHTKPYLIREEEHITDLI